MPLPCTPIFVAGPGQRPTRDALLLCNLGTPDAPTPEAVRRYLAEFLSDARIVELSPLIWQLALRGVILPRRSRASAAKYASIWGERGGVPQGLSPLLHWTREQARGVAQHLSAEFFDAYADLTHAVGVEGQPRPKTAHRVLGDQGTLPPLVTYAMRYGRPSLPAVLDALLARGAGRIALLPLYPQYSATTTASVWDAVCDWSRRQRFVPALSFANAYPTHEGYIAALAASVRQYWAEHGRGEVLLMSFHGVPAAMRDAGDPYVAECEATARALAAALALDDGQWQMTFQSRFGPAQWVEPYTEPTAQALAARGVRHIDVICPGFAADCIETLEEIDGEVREAFLHAGGERFGRIPCLNANADWLQTLAAIGQGLLR